MELEICVSIIGILIIIIEILLRKYLLKIGTLIKNSVFVNKIMKILEKFIYKVVEIFWIIVLGIIILIPLFIYYVMKNFCDIQYEQYKELLDMVLNSNYVIVIGIIIIIYLFRNPLKKKIGQIKEVNTNGVKFETQFEKNLEKNNIEKENCDTIPEDNEEIYEEIKDKISDDKNKLKSDKPNQNIIYELEEQLKEKDKIIKKNQFINIKDQIAKTTNIILVYIYGKYRIVNLFQEEEIKQILIDTFENENTKLNIDVETQAIIHFLLINKIIDTEDDKNYCITEYGVDFLDFLFKGRC